VLALALGLAGCGDSGTPSAPSAPGGQPAKAPGQPAKAPAAKAAQPEKASAVAFVYETKGRRDPFRPLIMPKVEKPKTSKPKTGLAALGVNELKLSGIVWHPRGYYALVEAPNGAGYVLRVNDTIGEDTRVTKITSEGVTFEVKMETSLPQARSRLVELRLRKEE
jgi:Tfp pilus assembly protein PilP